MPETLNGDAHGQTSLSEERWRGWVDARLADIIRRLDQLVITESSCQDTLKKNIKEVEERVERIEKLVENWRGKIYFGALFVGAVGAIVARIAVFFAEHIAHSGTP